MVEWQCLVPNEVWWCPRFLEDATYDRVMQAMRGSDHTVLDGSTRKHAVGHTYYNYNVVKMPVREDKELINEVFTKLNQLVTSLGDPPTDFSRPLTPLQFFAKTFNEDSRYDLHAESRGMFGKYVFMNYLSDEDSGELVFPTEEEADEYIRQHPDNAQGWEDTKKRLLEEQNPIRYCGPLRILPRRNTCAVFLTGVAHSVSPIVDSKNEPVRPSLCGWMSADDTYIKWYQDKQWSAHS